MINQLIKRNFLEFFKGSVLTKITSISIFLVVTSKLSLNDFSIYTIFFASIEILIVIVSLGYPSYILRINDKILSKETLIQSNNFTIINSCFVFVVVKLSYKLLEVDSTTYNYIFNFLEYFVLILIIKGILNNYRNYFITIKNARINYALDKASFLIDAILLAIIFFIEPLELDKLVFLLTVSNFLKLLFLITSNPKLKFRIVKYNLKSMPFFLKTLIGMISVYYSRFYLETTANYDDLAIYSFYFLIVSQGVNLISEPFSKAFIPDFRDKIDKIKKSNLSKGIKKYLEFCFLIMTISFLIILIKNFFDIKIPFVKVQYQENLYLLLILLGASIISNIKMPYSIWMYIEQKGTNRNLILFSLFDFMLSVFSYPLFYKLLGLKGIPIAYLFIVCINLLTHYLIFKSKIKLI